MTTDASLLHRTWINWCCLRDDRLWQRDRQRARHCAVWVMEPHQRHRDHRHAAQLQINSTVARVILFRPSRTPRSTWVHANESCRNCSSTGRVLRGRSVRSSKKLPVMETRSILKLRMKMLSLHLYAISRWFSSGQSLVFEARSAWNGRHMRHPSRTP